MSPTRPVRETKRNLRFFSIEVAGFYTGMTHLFRGGEHERQKFPGLSLVVGHPGLSCRYCGPRGGGRASATDPDGRTLIDGRPILDFRRRAGRGGGRERGHLQRPTGLRRLALSDDRGLGRVSFESLRLS